MGRQIDLDSPLSAEDKEYLNSRGRGHLIHANNRRFGEDGTRTPEEHELAGAPSQSPFYDTQERDRATYDTGGAPLPGATLDYDTGRAYDRANGVTVEPQHASHTPGAFPVDSVASHLQENNEGFASRDEDDSDIDEDIAAHVTGMKVAELRTALDGHGVEYGPKDKQADLQDMLAIHLQDKRNAEIRASQPPAPASDELTETEIPPAPEA